MSQAVRYVFAPDGTLSIEVDAAAVQEFGLWLSDEWSEDNGPNNETMESLIEAIENRKPSA